MGTSILLLLGFIVIVVVFSLSAILPERSPTADSDRDRMESTVHILREALMNSDEHHRARIQLEQQADEHLARMFPGGSPP